MSYLVCHTKPIMKIVSIVSLLRTHHKNMTLARPFPLKPHSKKKMRWTFSGMSGQE